MKFLVLALCVCAASAAPYQPWQAKKVGQAFAQASVSEAPKTVYRAVEQSPPVAVAKSVAYNAPVAAAKVANYAEEAAAAVVRSESDVSADGYSFNYETNNGISAQSSGALKKVNNEDVLVIQGSYEYPSPDGGKVQVSYVADENGYQPKSDLLPVGPAIPDYIIRSLEYIAAHPQKVEKY